jgi:hypothetical protein
MTRNTSLTGLAAVVVLVITGIALWNTRERAETPSVASAPHTDVEGAQESTSWRADTGTDRQVLPEQLTNARCFGDLLAIDQAKGFDGVRLALSRGLGGDELGAEYLRARVAELIGDDVEKALEVLAWARRATPDEAAVLLAGLAASNGAKDPRVAAALIELGRADDANAAVRAAALDALRTQPRLDNDGRLALKGIAVGDNSDDGELAWHATRALGNVMGEAMRTDSAQIDAFQPYWEELADIAETSGDPAVRALALEASAITDPILPAASIARLTDMMLDEPHRDVRELAAFQLGLTEAPDEAIAAYRRAFEQEYDECVRWAIVRFAVRAGGEDALPLLEYFASIDAAFVDDVADFKALFAAGYQDFEQIWLNKEERHACVVEEGELHGT